MRRLRCLFARIARKAAIADRPILSLTATALSLLNAAACLLTLTRIRF